MRTTTRGKLGAAIGLAIAPVLLASCSMIGSLTPVPGLDVSALGFAANYVLLEQKVDVMVSPDCDRADELYTCRGETFDDQEILVTAPTKEPLIMKVSVAGKEVFCGSVEEVLQCA